MADISKHSKENQFTLRAIMSAGLWDKHLLQKAGIARDSTCERCGNTRDDIYHRFWECIVLKSTCDEDASLFQDFRYCEAPACLTSCGLAVELAGDVTGAFWTRSAGRDQDQLHRKRKYDEWEQIQCEMEVEGKLPDKCLQTIMGQTGFSTSNFTQKYKAKANPYGRPTHLQMLQSFCQGYRGPPTLGLALYTSTGTSSLTPPHH